MASNKNFLLLLGVLLLFVLFVSSQVAASNDETTGLKTEDGRGGYNYPGGGNGGGYPGRGGGYPGRGGGYPGRGGGGGRCKYGCCRGYRYGSGCNRCCATAHEAPDAQFEDDLHN